MGWVECEGSGDAEFIVERIFFSPNATRRESYFLQIQRGENLISSAAPQNEPLCSSSVRLDVENLYIALGISPLDRERDPVPCRSSSAHPTLAFAISTPNWHLPSPPQSSLNSPHRAFAHLLSNSLLYMGHLCPHDHFALGNFYHDHFVLGNFYQQSL